MTFVVVAAAVMIVALVIQVLKSINVFCIGYDNCAYLSYVYIVSHSACYVMYVTC
jgi:hypothetical protein